MTDDRDIRVDGPDSDPAATENDAPARGDQGPTAAADEGGSFAIWLSIGAALGIVFGEMWGNVGVGVALGSCLGIVLDSAFSAVEKRRSAAKQQ